MFTSQVMLKVLIEGNGKASLRSVAAASSLMIRLSWNITSRSPSGCPEGSWGTTGWWSERERDTTYPCRSVVKASPSRMSRKPYRPKFSSETYHQDHGVRTMHQKRVASVPKAQTPSKYLIPTSALVFWHSLLRPGLLG